MSKRMTRPPLLLEDFESARTTSEGAGRRWGSKAEKTYASVEIVDKQSHPHIIRSGNHALKFDYDFRYETTEGGSRRAYFTTYGGENDHPRADLSIKDDPHVLVIPEGEYPTHLAMWVYGDNNDAWFNGMIIDSDGKSMDVTCGDQDWVGWKFITMDIPPNFKLPLYVVYAARLLTGNQTIHGTLYVDEIMAIYGGIDFDALPPSITRLSAREEPSDLSGFPVISALLCDLDDDENGCAASGVDISRTEVRIDGVRHKNNLCFEPSAKDTVLTFTPDFSLCGGQHKLVIVAFDHAGNRSQAHLFFDVHARAPGVYRSVDDSVEFGGSLFYRFFIEGSLKDTKTSLSIKYDSDMLVPAKNFFTAAPGVTASVQYDESHVFMETVSGKNEGRFEFLTLEFVATSAHDGARETVLVCENAELESQGKAEQFCLADAKVAIEPGLCLLVERLCRGYDTVFTVTDAQGQPVVGAKVYDRQSDTEYPGRTDARGRVSVSGVSNADTGTKLDLYARKENRFSLTARYSVSNDFGVEEPTNINVSCGKDSTEISVTWQTGVGITEGAIRYALKTPEKTELTADDALMKAERSNNFSAFKDESCEMNGYSVCLPDVKPDAEYLYKVGSGDVWSEIKVLKTIPAQGEYSFAVLADTHNVCGEAMRAALKFDPELSFFAHMGDFVSAGGVYDDWLAYFDDAKGLFATYPTVPLSGNHDLSDGTGANYRMIYNNPQNGVVGAPKGLYYYTELNNTLFISLGGGYEDDAAIMDWITQTIRKTSMKWIIILVHEGPYTCYINSASEELKWGEFFGKAGVDLVLSGHDHTFHRATIKDHETLDVDQKNSSADGVTYLQCATSGGASNHNWAKHRPIWNAVYDSKTPSASIFRVSDEKIQVNSLCVADNAEGFEEFDWFELTK
ncbi:MAG TPA: metallophosphoesterase [Clostridia bacterium]|nr:metallophosphoesterase [Clostridia bacterium]